MTPRINLRRLTECSLCDRPTPTRDNAKEYGDERDRAVLCGRCERQVRAEVAQHRMASL